jgi:phospholipid/cholesterol/gamma-HCH transport system ATP-binding protein
MDATQPKPETTPSRNGDPVVRLVDLHKSFGALPVLDGLDIDFQRGRTTVVLGPSGCGKSVMLKHTIGLLKPDAGEVWYEDERVDVLGEADLGTIRRRFGYLFQHSALFDSVSVHENVAFPLVEHTRLPPRQRRERVAEVLDEVGMLSAMDQMPAELSGGQRKRVALARAIVLQPDVILYDEPTTGLDPLRANVINELMLKLQRDLRATSIVVTHDLGSAFQVADEMIMLHAGRVILRGTPDEFRASSIPEVKRFMTADGREKGTKEPDAPEIESFVGTRAGAPVRSRSAQTSGGPR